jgi:hypothetical protein
MQMPGADRDAMAQVRPTLLPILEAFPNRARAHVHILARVPVRRHPASQRLYRTRIAVYDELSALENLRLSPGSYHLPHADRSAREGLEAEPARARARRTGARILARHAPAAGSSKGVPCMALGVSNGHHSPRGRSRCCRAANVVGMPSRWPEPSSCPPTHHCAEAMELLLM